MCYVKVFSLFCKTFVLGLHISREDCQLLPSPSVLLYTLCVCVLCQHPAPANKNHLSCFLSDLNHFQFSTGSPCSCLACMLRWIVQRSSPLCRIREGAHGREHYIGKKNGIFWFFRDSDSSFENPAVGQVFKRIWRIVCSSIFFPVTVYVSFYWVHTIYILKTCFSSFSFPGV